MFVNKWKDIQIFALYTTKRYKMNKKYWSQNSKKSNTIEKALHHFDEFYGSVFGSRWESMRKAIQRKQKYVALINNYGDDKETIELLKSLGAHDLKRMFESQKNFNDNCDIIKNDATVFESEDFVKSFADQVNQTEIENIYGSNVNLPNKLDVGQMVLKQTGTVESIEQSQGSASLISNLKEASIDESRIIDAAIGMSASSLYTYVPATKLKGREDWLPESHYYSYYQNSKDFPLTVEEDSSFEFPEHLKVYAFEPGNDSMFPEPRRGKTDVFNCYMMDGSSILPVLALGLKPRDKVLDLCAAPGGKSLTILQTLLPDVLVANDISPSRIRRLNNVFKDYLHDYELSNKWRERIIISKMTGQSFEDQDGFDKILVDVPCTTDRHSIKENENNIFNVSRIKERLRIPELQSALLSQALSLCKVGGTVVYSTCTFSPIQNDGVVHMALKNVWENKGIQATIKTTQKLADVAKSLYKFGGGKAAPKYGQLVVPHFKSNFGPLYFAKIIRTQ